MVSDQTSAHPLALVQTAEKPISVPQERYATWSLSIFTVLLFCQLWGNVAGFTLRAEDALAIVLLGVLLLPALLTGKLRYYRHPLNAPLLLWAGFCCWALP